MAIQFNSLPVDGPLRITSPFGLRNTGIAGASTYHKGVDLGRDFSKSETAILAVAPGVVLNSYWNNTRGWVVIIDHNGFKTLSQHLREKGPPSGTRVKDGQQIGIMGASTKTIKNMAAHLHFELIVNGRPVDAGPYLRNIRKEVELMMTKEELEKLIDGRIEARIEARGKSVSSWAKPFWEARTADGTVDGSNPKGIVTREQAAVMLSKIIER